MRYIFYSIYEILGTEQEFMAQEAVGGWNFLVQLCVRITITVYTADIFSNLCKSLLYLFLRRQHSLKFRL